MLLYSSFHSIKWPGVSLCHCLSLIPVLVHQRYLLFYFSKYFFWVYCKFLDSHFYSCVERGTVRIKCFNQELRQLLQSGLEPLGYSQSHRLEKTYSNQQFVGSSSIIHVSVFIVIRSCFVQLWSVCWTKSWSPYSGCIRWYQRTTQNLSDTSWHLVPHWSVLHLVVSWFNVLIFKNSGHVFSLKLYNDLYM